VIEVRVEPNPPKPIEQKTSPPLTAVAAEQGLQENGELVEQEQSLAREALEQAEGRIADLLPVIADGFTEAELQRAYFGD
jgi:hypothetical protein